MYYTVVTFLLIFLAGLLLGYVFKKDKQGIKVLMSDDMINSYNNLSTKSKRHVNSEIIAQEATDER